MFDFSQGNLNDMKRNLTAIAGRVGKLERLRRKGASSSPGSAAANAGEALIDGSEFTQPRNSLLMGLCTVVITDVVG